MLETGELARLIDEDAVVGVTSNPTIFQKALAEGDCYDEQLRELAARPTTPSRSSSRSRWTTSARPATSCARSGSAPTASTAGSRSRSTRPRLRPRAHVRAGDAVQQRGRAGTTCSSRSRPPSPASARSRTAIAEGVSINVTLIFSLERYAAVAEAYVRGLERLVAAGGDPTHVASVASFFVSRVDTEADRRLEAARSRRPAGTARGREREARLPALPRRLRRRALGLPRRARARGRSAACGPRPRRRTRPTATCSTSRS